MKRNQNLLLYEKKDDKYVGKNFNFLYKVKKFDVYT